MQRAKNVVLNAVLNKDAKKVKKTAPLPRYMDSAKEIISPALWQKAFLRMTF